MERMVSMGTESTRMSGSSTTSSSSSSSSDSRSWNIFISDRGCVPGSVAWQPDSSPHMTMMNDSNETSCVDAFHQNMTSQTQTYDDVIWPRDGPMPLGIRVAGGTMGTVVLVLGVFGNVVVILAVWHYRPLRKSSNLFVTSLALCDLFHSALVRPLYVYSYIVGDWHFGAHLCVYALISSNLAILENILHVTSIAFHRYVILVHPRLAVCFQRRLAIVLMLAAIYVLPLTVVLVQASPRFTAQLTMGRDVIFNRRIMFCSFVRHSDFRVSGVVKKMSFVIVSSLFIFYCYIRIYHLVRRRGQSLSVHGSFSPIRLRRELTLLRTVIAVFLTFVVNYLPITLIYGTDTKRTLPYVAYFVGVMFLWTSSGVNWIIYGIMNIQYSRAYRFLFCGGGAGNSNVPSVDGATVITKLSHNLATVRDNGSVYMPVSAESKRVSRPGRLPDLPEGCSAEENFSLEPRETII